MREDLAADVGDYSLAKSDNEVRAACGRQRQHRRNGTQHNEIIGDQGRIRRGEASVYHAAHRQRQCQRHSGRQHEGNSRARHQLAVAVHIGKQPPQWLERSAPRDSLP